MIENLKMLLEKKYNYSLDQMIMCRPEVKKSKIRIPSFILFGLILIGYILQQVDVVDEYYDLLVVLAAFVVFVMIPLGLTKTNRYSAIIVTPKYIIQIMNKKEFVIIDYDKITGFEKDDKVGIILKQNRKKIVIPSSCYYHELEKLVEILEAKGKTFDSSRDFMIRDISIEIKNGNIVITDIEKVTDTDILYEKYYEKYQMLTPGFIDDIIFLNAVIDKSTWDQKNWVLQVNRLEVKEGHPENTTFDSIVVEDTVLIFQNVSIVSITKQDARDKSSAVEKLNHFHEDKTLDLSKGIISDWRHDDEFMFEFAVGMYRITVYFEFEEVLIGWNKIKK